MKLLLTAVAIVAALCVVGIAAPGQEGLPPAPGAAPAFDPYSTAPGDTLPGQDPKLRAQYLRTLQKRADQMSNEELRTAIRAAEVETERARAEKMLQEAAEILATIYPEHANTEHGEYAARMLKGLMELGITSEKLRIETSNFPASQAPTLNPQTR